MFKKFKEKIKNWTKKVSEEAEEISEEIIEEVKEKPKKDKKKLNKEEIVENIQVRQKFDVATHKVEPDLEEIEKKADKIEKEDVVEESKPSEKGFFKKITSKINKIKISEKDFEIYGEELEMLLLENNVALEVAEKIVKELRERLIGKEILKKEIEDEIKDNFKEIIKDILVEPFDLVDKIKKKESNPYVVLFCGINGTGKTTTIAKIAESFKKKDISCVLAAADTFRAASIEQIKTHGERLGVEVISHEYGSDPASVGFDAIQYAKKKKIDCVLIDTAGRMHTDKNLIRQIEKIAKVCKPDTKIFVGESITGNDAIEQVKSFDWAVGIDGIILTKADIDEKGGTSLSVGYVTKKPILYLGTGQEYDKIELFDKEKFIGKLGLD